MNFYEKVYVICQRIPKGKVASYGQIALLAGKPKAPRQVGRALNTCSEEIILPAHRVVNCDGYLSGAGAFFLEHGQRQMLRSEGVEVSNENRVDMKKFQWTPDDKEIEEIHRLMASQ